MPSALAACHNPPPRLPRLAERTLAALRAHPRVEQILEAAAGSDYSEAEVVAEVAACLAEEIARPHSALPREAAERAADAAVAAIDDARLEQIAAGALAEVVGHSGGSSSWAAADEVAAEDA
jgi:hypothetical protein